MLAIRRFIKPCRSNSQFSFAVGTKPVPGIVVPLIGEAHGDANFTKRPEFLDEAVVKLFGHFRVRNSMIAARPERNSARFRQTVSVI